MIKKVFCILCILACRHVTAQHLRRPFAQDVRFVQYLHGTQQFGDALLALNEIPLAPLTAPQKDTFNYLKGWSFYNVKDLDSATRYLLKVGAGSPYYVKSRFFSAYNSLYLDRYDSAAAILKTITPSASTAEIRSFESAGLALLQHRYKRFDSLKAAFTYDRYALTAQEKNFTGYRQQLLRIKKKSPLVAGLLSAIVPGTGKIYAGKTYQGIASMLPMAALALLTNESYHKGGPRSAEFYIFGSMLTVFYVGNIWGSVFAVKINRDEQEKLIHQKVLLDLQIPLRTIFD
jgi:hypothetical protein